MRKIDAVLLSALILYDYSAQSLVDNDAISFGKSFISSKFHDNKLTEPGFEFNPEFNDKAASNGRGVKRLSAKLNTSDSKGGNISYYELANINPETKIDINETIKTSTINIPFNVATEITTTETMSAETTTPENENFLHANVTLNENEYSALVEISASKITERVADEADMLTFDSDNDGTYDIEDRCPGVAGVARFEGCPVPDSDADGVNDEEDRCPLEKGSIENHGCLIEVNTQPTTATSSVEKQTLEKSENFKYAFTLSFQTGSKILSTDDFNIVLRITDILIQKPEARVEIDGRTIKNNSDSETPVEKLVHYFRELGVKDSQLMIKSKTQNINSASESNKLYMRLII